MAQSYLNAFAAIEVNLKQCLAAVELDGAVVGTLQIMYRLFCRTMPCAQAPLGSEVARIDAHRFYG